MKRFTIFFYFLSVLILFSTTSIYAETIKVKVVGVIDGDTITVLMPDKSQKRVRINGIDAPEKEQDFWEEARQKLSSLILNKNVILKFSKIQPNTEILGRISLNGTDIGLEMLKTGHAWCDIEQEELLDPQDEENYCNSAYKSRQQLIGLWQNPNAQPPWEFKRYYVPEIKIQGPDIRSSTVFEGQVMEIIDGNSIALKMANNSRLAICISRLEVPEPGQPKADIAEQHLKDLLIQKNILVKISGFPEFENCVSGDVYLNGININLQMVRDGVAWVNKNYFYPEGYYTYELAEQSARNERRGIWEDTNPTSPWEYREAFYRANPNFFSSLDSSYGGYGSSSNTPGGPKTVRVRSYTRSDGTRVRSHTRSAPGSGGGRSSSGRRKN